MPGAGRAATAARRAGLRLDAEEACATGPWRGRYLGARRTDWPGPGARGDEPVVGRGLRNGGSRWPAPRATREKARGLGAAAPPTTRACRRGRKRFLPSRAVAASIT